MNEKIGDIRLQAGDVLLMEVRDMSGGALLNVHVYGMDADVVP